MLCTIWFTPAIHEEEATDKTPAPCHTLLTSAPSARRAQTVRSQTSKGRRPAFLVKRARRSTARQTRVRAAPLERTATTHGRRPRPTTSAQSAVWESRALPLVPRLLRPARTALRERLAIELVRPFAINEKSSQKRKRRKASSVTHVYCIAPTHQSLSSNLCHRPLRLHRLQRRVLLGPKRTDKRMQVLPSRQVCQRERLGKMQGLPNRSLRRQAGRDARRTGQRVRRPLRRGPLRRRARSKISAVRGPMSQGIVQPPWGYRVPALSTGKVRQRRWQWRRRVYDSGLHWILPFHSLYGPCWQHVLPSVGSFSHIFARSNCNFRARWWWLTLPSAPRQNSG